MEWTLYERLYERFEIITNTRNSKIIGVQDFGREEKRKRDSQGSDFIFKKSSGIRGLDDMKICLIYPLSIYLCNYEKYK